MRYMFHIYALLQTADANLSFDAQILEAAKSIAAATKNLVQSARATQRELTEQGKVSVGTVAADSQWSDGLVSAVSKGKGGEKIKISVFTVYSI